MANGAKAWGQRGSLAGACSSRGMQLPVAEPKMRFPCASGGMVGITVAPVEADDCCQLLASHDKLPCRSAGRLVHFR